MGFFRGELTFDVVCINSSLHYAFMQILINIHNTYEYSSDTLLLKILIYCFQDRSKQSKLTEEIFSSN